MTRRSGARRWRWWKPAGTAAARNRRRAGRKPLEPARLEGRSTGAVHPRATRGTGATAAAGTGRGARPEGRFKKSLGHPCRTVRERFTQMKTLEAHHPITTLCAAFGVSRSGYYRWRAPKPTVRGGEDARLKIEIKTCTAQSRGTYGRPRLLAGLRQRGQGTSGRRVARLMRELGLRGVRKGGYRPRTTDSRHQLACWPNRLREAPPPQSARSSLGQRHDLRADARRLALRRRGARPVQPPPARPGHGRAAGCRAARSGVAPGADPARRQPAG
jgi:hypothetical protein